MSPYLATRTHLPRRAFLRGAGITLALPFLEAMTPAFARAATTPRPPKRFVAMCATLGFHTPFLHPKESLSLKQEFSESPAIFDTATDLSD